jgi:hypothetical protein
MKIKNFSLFESEATTKSKSFTADQFDNFCEEVSKWSKENDQKVIWCIYGDPKPSTVGYNSVWKKESAKQFWSKFVTGNKQFTLVEMPDSLVGVLHTDDNIEMAYDNLDRPVDKSKLKDLI